MGTTPLPLNEKPYYNTDNIANSIAADDMVDIYLEPVPGVGFVSRRRPGLKPFADLETGKPGNGLHWWDAKGQLIAVSDGKVFKVSEDGTATDITDAAPNGGITVQFAEGQDTGGSPWLYMATGKLIYTTGETTQTPITLQERTITPNEQGLASSLTSAPWSLSAHSYSDTSFAIAVTLTGNSDIDNSGKTATITGTDIYDVAQVETVFLPNGKTTVTSVNKYKTVASVVPSASIGTPADSTALGTIIGSTSTIATKTSDVSGAHVTIKNGSGTDYSGSTCTIIGLDLSRNSVSETIHLPAANATVTSVNVFSEVSNVLPPVAPPGSDTLEVGWSISENNINIGWAAKAGQIGSDNVPNSTHVAFVKGSFLGNEPGTNRFDFTDTNPTTGETDNAYWASTDNPLTCDAMGDLLAALFVAWQEVYCWGRDGLEIWQNDGVTPFTPIPGAFSEGGIEAVYSPVIADNTVFALCVIGGTRVVVKLQGRAPVVVSDPIARILAEMDDVSDAIGDLIGVGGLAMYLLTFPSAKQSWAYDYKNDVWTRWGYWNQTEGQHDHFLGQHAAFVKPWNKHLIMSRVDGKIYELDRGTFDDAGTEMVSYRRTGWLNHGTYNRKVCDQFYVKCKAGMSNIGTLLVRLRDEGREEWGNYMEIPLSPVGQRDFLAKINRMGTYRSRQYEFRFSDNADLVLVGVDTEIRGLSS